MCDSPALLLNPLLCQILDVGSTAAVRLDVDRSDDQVEKVLAPLRLSSDTRALNALGTDGEQLDVAARRKTG